MSIVSSLDDIPELKEKHVHVRNIGELLEKINKVIQGGHDKLQIVTDFDHTLTRHTMDNGTSVLTSFGMLRECPSIPQHYKDEDNRLSSIYKPIECDPVMTVEEKTKHMIEWYKAAREQLTKGVTELINWSQAQQVPVLVFSAGLGESVVAALKAANYLLPNVKVVSNFLALDESDKIIGIKGEVIHTYNKNETVIKNTDYYELVKERSNVLLMGDNIGDSGMAEGMDHCDVIIKIGFLGNNAEGNLQNYLNKFDIVSVNDPTMNIINAILKRVL